MIESHWQRLTSHFIYFYPQRGESTVTNVTNERQMNELWCAQSIRHWFLVTLMPFNYL